MVERPIEFFLLSLGELRIAGAPPFGSELGSEIVPEEELELELAVVEDTTFGIELELEQLGLGAIVAYSNSGRLFAGGKSTKKIHISDRSTG